MGVAFILDMLLSAEEESLQVSACIALCSILEVGCLNKFLEEDEFSADMSVDERATKLKEHIRNHAKGLRYQGPSSKAICNLILSSSKAICNHILYFVEKGHLDVAVQVDGGMSTMLTLSQTTQLAFLRNFLRHGFKDHMLEIMSFELHLSFLKQESPTWRVGLWIHWLQYLCLKMLSMLLVR